MALSSTPDAEPLATLPRLSREAAFSMVELIATLAIIGVLAAVAIPRLVSRTAFEARGVYDQAQAIIRYAQKIAVAQRQSPPKGPLFVVIAPASISVCYDAGCASAVRDPTTGNPLVLNAPPGVVLTPPTTFSFGGSGAPSLAGRLSVTVSATGEANRTFFVEATTGYVHE